VTFRVVLAAVALATVARAQPATDPQELVFLLQYVGTDYGNAVRDGAVANQFEYGEVLRFTRRVIDGYGTLRGHRASVTRALGTLEKRIGDRAPEREVWTLANRLVAKVNRTVGGAVRPEQIPNLANGRRLWMADCALCHGLEGGGDGSASPNMEPPPTAFRGEFLERVSPAQVYNAVSLGIGGTAMPSFANAYTPHQRWDVAFYAMTLRLGFDPKRPPAGTTFSLEDVASSSNETLLEQLRRTAPDASPEQVDWFRANLVSPHGATAPMAGPASAATGGLALAMQMQDAFASVAERVFPRVVGISSWVKDPTWTDQRLRAEKGDGWVVANADQFRYLGFRRIHVGSGFIVDDEGFVVSADSVVRDDAGALVPLVEVELPDESRVPGAIVGNEPMLDLAVLRLENPPSGLPPLEIGDSDRVQAGHWLIALGDPPGPDRSFVVGVAAMSPQRQCYQATLSATRLQTSLQVPPGAIGGPVVDILGHVIGMGVGQAHSVDGGPSGGVMPITLVMNLFEALKTAKSHQSPWLGISVLELQTLRKQVAAGKHAPVAMPPTGVFIDDVFTPSPASRSNVRSGDFLIALGGHPVLSVGDFQTWLYATGVGAVTELTLVRDGRTLGVQVQVEVRPASATSH
jgi:S1-C subfamily serine protease/mono/diheme cytochrome c family protein